MPPLNNAFFNKEARTFVFIDGPNNYAASKSLNIDIDYKKLRDGLRAVTRLIRIYYYTPVTSGDEYSSIKPLLDWLDYNGYTIVTKPFKEFTSDEGRRRLKGSMGIEIALEAQRQAMNRSMDHMVLFSGNSDFRPLIETIKALGVFVTVISTRATEPALVADELRRAADQFIELEDMDIADEPPRGRS